MKTIGVVIPCYLYHIPKLYNVLNSIKNQTVQPDHVVISCSSTMKDNKDISEILSIFKQYFRLDIITTQEYKNAAENRNIASRYISTDIISYIDSDDIMYSQRLEAIKDVFSKTDCLIVLHNFDMDIKLSEIHLKNNNFNYEYGKLVKSHRYHGIEHVDDLNSQISINHIHHAHSSVLKEVFQKIKYKEEIEYTRIEDSIFCRDVLDFAGFKNVYINQPLTVYFCEGQTVI